jgi:O-antigen ligase
MSALFYVLDDDWSAPVQDLREDVWRDIMEQTTASGSTSRRFALLTLGAVGAGALFRPGRQSLRIDQWSALLSLLFLSWCVASWFWADERGLVARRLIAMGCVVLVAWASVRHGSPRHLVLLAFWCSAAYLLIGLAAELWHGTLQSFGPEYRFSGTQHPTDQGTNCAILCLSSLALQRHVPASRQRWFRLTAVVGFTFLLLTRSRGALAACLCAYVSFRFGVASPRARVAGLLTVICVASLIVLVIGTEIVDGLFQVALMNRSDSDAGTLTGRLPVWEELLGYLSQRPWLGYGFNGFWTVKHISELSGSQHWGVSSGHSAYLDVALGVGCLGLALGLPVLLVTTLRALRAARQIPGQGYEFVSLLLLLCLFNGILESNIVLPHFVAVFALAGVIQMAFCELQTTPSLFPAPSIGGTA